MLILPLVLFRSSFATGGNVFMVRFTDISGVSEGAPVYFAGKPVGKVAEIKNIIDLGEKDSEGYLYCHELILKIEPETVILPLDEITLIFPRLIGEKVVNICPKDPGIRKLSEAVRFYGKNSDVFKKTEILMERLDHATGVLVNNITLMTDDVSALSVICSEFITDFKKNKILKDVAGLLENRNQDTERPLKGSIAGFLESIDNINEITSDIKDYGLLYQYNREWKKKKRSS
ncbi:MAG: MlaD family protein [Victivallaceae bacterium]